MRSEQLDLIPRGHYNCVGFGSCLPPAHCREKGDDLGWFLKTLSVGLWSLMWQVARAQWFVGLLGSPVNGISSRAPSIGPQAEG